MAAQQYKTLITNTGSAKIAAAVAAGQKVPTIQSAAAGDGNGAYYMPSQNQTALKKEVWRGLISYAEIDEDEPQLIHVRIIIPPDAGGFIVREAAIFDADGDMLAVCNLPDTKKEVYATGTMGRLTIIMHILVTDTGVLNFELHPDLDSVSPEEMAAAITAHNVNTSAHADIRAAVQAAQTTANAAYKKPAAGIPKTDLTSAVQASLSKADAAQAAADTALASSQAYTDQKIGAATMYDELGFFHYGRSSSSIAFPTTGVVKGDKAYDFGSNKAYEYSGSSWGQSASQPVPQTNSRIDIDEFLDGVSTSGASLVGMKGAGLYIGGVWQFGLDANTQSIPDGQSIIRRTADGYLAVSAEWLKTQTLNKTVFDNISFPSSGWTESTYDGEPAYTQTVTVSGLPDSDFTPSVVYTIGDIQAMRKEAQAAACVTAWVSATGAITAYCLYGKPEQDIKISIEIIK